MRCVLPDNTEEVLKIAKALTNQVRLNIIQHLCTKEMSVKELHRVVTGVKYRDAIYRHLELLKTVGLLDKFYDDRTKELKYKLAQDSITIVFGSRSSANMRARQ